VDVGLVTTGFPRFDGDHCGAFLLTVARGLVRNGHRVRVLAPEPASKASPPTWPGIEVAWVPYARPRALQTTFYGDGAPDNLRLRPARWLGAASYSVALLHHAQHALADCDALVSSWCFPSGWVASSIANRRNHLCICHATDIRWLSRAPGGRFLARAIASGATSMWFLSESHREQFFRRAALDPNAVAGHVGPMPIDRPPPHHQTRRELRARLNLDRFTVLFLGRLVPVKGGDLLLHAAASLGPSVHVRIAGDGPERDRLVRLARALGVDATLEGWVRGERKEALLRACDVLVVPSREHDGLPTVLLEAEARSLPVIATRVGAIAEHARAKGSTRLVAPDDPGALSAAIGELGQGATRSVPFGGL